MKDLKPRVQPGVYVFCTVPEERAADLEVTPVGQFHEAEGVTVIVEQEAADRLALAYDAVWSMITLTAETGLTDIGILAYVSRKLADAGIPVNAVSAFYHDHLFVPCEKAEEALHLLTGE